MDHAVRLKWPTSVFQQTRSGAVIRYCCTAYLLHPKRDARRNRICKPTSEQNSPRLEPRSRWFTPPPPRGPAGG